VPERPRRGSRTGVPDGIFSNQKFQFGYILEGLAMEDVGIFLALWPILLQFGIFCGSMVYFMVIWYIFTILVCCTKNNLATLPSVTTNIQ
jgi:hypothetical protein